MIQFENGLKPPTSYHFYHYHQDYSSLTIVSLSYCHGSVSQNMVVVTDYHRLSL